MPENQSLSWLPFALLTVSMFGVYGVLLHKGVIGMADAQNGRYKAFLWVGIAYFLVAVLAPLILMLVKQVPVFEMTTKGITWSLFAGIAGAIGAFGILLAFGAKGTPAVVMSIVFAGAPIVNATVATMLHPPKDGFGSINPLFFLGILLAAGGGLLVTLFNPGAGKPPKPPTDANVTAPEAAAPSPNVTTP